MRSQLLIPVNFFLQLKKKDTESFFTLFSAEEAHLAVQKMCEELKQKLNTTDADKQSQYLKMTAEIDDLNRTKTNLEERLIELIRYGLVFVNSCQPFQGCRCQCNRQIDS